MNSRVRIVLIGVVLLAVIGGGALLFQKPAPAKVAVTTSNAAAIHHPLALLSAPADFVTPLGNGYIYFNKTTRGVNYSDASGTQDITASFSLTTDPNPSKALGGDPVRDSVVNIESTRVGAAVTTIRGVFLATSPVSVTKLADFPGETFNFTDSAYDRGTNCLFLLSAYSKTVLRYDLGRPTAAPEKVYSAPGEIDRIAAGGGILAVYYDDVPSAEPGVLAEYAKTKQLDPLILNATTSKVTTTLTDFRASTYLSVSGSGKYLAIKRKLEPTITVYSLADRRTAELPSYDTGGAAWQDDDFYLARGGAIWSYAAGSDKLLKFAGVSQPVTSIRTTPKSINITTNADITGLLAPLSQTHLPFIIQPQTTPAGPYNYTAVDSERE